MRRFHYSMGTQVVQDWVLKRAPVFATKLAWFIEHGYEPHLYQLAFHTLCDDTQQLLAHRFLVAGRRGGKTLSAAWETVYYCLNPAQFHWDAHKKQDGRSLHVWILVPNLQNSGRAARRAVVNAVLKQSGLVEGADYRYNRGDLTIEFSNGSFIEFKTAERPDMLVGAGIDILWIDEFCVIPNKEAYEYASPALDDRLGIVYATSTPRDKNWGYDLGWGPAACADETIGTVEYTSIHSPYYPRERWMYRKRNVHPLVFKREYMASFDAAAGKELWSEWLHTYDLNDLPLKKEGLGPQWPNGALRIPNLDLDIYMGVDPATSLSDEADRFAISVLGIAKDRNQGYLLDTYLGRLEFPDQPGLIREWYLRWRPQVIVVESVAYQAALAQTLNRIKGMPPINAQVTRSKKSERILAMSPSFKYRQVLIRADMNDFINEWLDYDSTKTNPKDDLLDATEMALRGAGIILPVEEPEPDPKDRPAADIKELALRQQPQPWNPFWDDEERDHDYMAYE